jgi:hypothetical protein
MVYTYAIFILNIKPTVQINKFLGANNVRLAAIIIICKGLAC